MDENNRTISEEAKICKEALKNGMKPIAGDNVNLPAVDQNFQALGTGISEILTAKSNIIANEDLQTWIKNINQYLSQLSEWQQAVNKTINNWQPTQPTEQNLKTELQNLTQPNLPKLKVLKQIGKIQLLDDDNLEK